MKILESTRNSEAIDRMIDRISAAVSILKYRDESKDCDMLEAAVRKVYNACDELEDCSSQLL